MKRYILAVVASAAILSAAGCGHAQTPTGTITISGSTITVHGSIESKCLAAVDAFNHADETTIVAATLALENDCEAAAKRSDAKS